MSEIDNKELQSVWILYPRDDRSRRLYVGDDPEKKRAKSYYLSLRGPKNATAGVTRGSSWGEGLFTDPWDCTCNDCKIERASNRRGLFCDNERHYTLPPFVDSWRRISVNSATVDWALSGGWVRLQAYLHVDALDKKLNPDIIHIIIDYVELTKPGVPWWMVTTDNGSRVVVPNLDSCGPLSWSVQVLLDKDALVDIVKE
jgi:hypothetical protein